MKWITGGKWHIESDPPRFTIGKSKHGDAHRTWFRYTLADGQTLVGAYNSADEAKAAAEAINAELPMPKGWH